MDFDVIKERQQAQSILELIKSHYPSLTCSIDEKMDKGKLVIYIWILADPGYRPDLNQVLANNHYEDWLADEWMNSDQRAEFCSVTRVG